MVTVVAAATAVSCLCHRVNRFCILFPSNVYYYCTYAYGRIFKPYVISLLRSSPPPPYSHRLLYGHEKQAAAAEKQRPSTHQRFEELYARACLRVCISFAAIFRRCLFVPLERRKPFRARARALHAHYF